MTCPGCGAVGSSNDDILFEPRTDAAFTANEPAYRCKNCNVSFVVTEHGQTITEPASDEPGSANLGGDTPGDEAPVTVPRLSVPRMMLWWLLGLVGVVAAAVMLLALMLPPEPKVLSDTIEKNIRDRKHITTRVVCPQRLPTDGGEVFFCTGMTDRGVMFRVQVTRRIDDPSKFDLSFRLPQQP